MTLVFQTVLSLFLCKLVWLISPGFSCCFTKNLGDLKLHVDLYRQSHGVHYHICIWVSCAVLFFFFFASKSFFLTPGNIHFEGINHTLVWIIFLAVIQLINHMKKPYVVMLSYHHHRHTSKTTVYGKPILWGRENKSSQTIMWLNV